MLWSCLLVALRVFFFRRRRFVLNDPDGISKNLGFTVRALLPFSGIRKLTDLLERAMAVLSARVYLFTLAWTFSVLLCQHLPTWSCLGLSARSFFFFLEVAPAPFAIPLCSCGHPSRFVLLVLCVHFDGSCLLMCSAVCWVLVTVCGTLLLGVASVF